MAAIVSLHLPAAQPTQGDPPPSLNFPAVQGVQDAIDVPPLSEELFPAGQDVQEPAPSAEYFDAAHAVHDIPPDAYLPLGHVMEQEVASAVEDFPASQIAQSNE